MRLAFTSALCWHVYSYAIRVIPLSNETSNWELVPYDFLLVVLYTN